MRQAPSARQAARSSAADHTQKPANGRMNDNRTVNILVVDDRPDSLMALDAALTGIEGHVVRVQSGREALEFLLQSEAAVVLLDVKMADINGYETAALIRQREKTRDVPIIFVTAFHTEEADVARGYAYGAVDYVFKPFVPEVLKAKVRCFVDMANKNAALQRKNEELRQADEELRRTKATAQETQARLQQQNRTLVELTKSAVVDSPNLSSALEKITAAAATALEVARAGVWLFDAEHSALRCRCLYESRDDRYSEGTEWRAEDCPDYFKALEEERTLAAHDVGTDPRTAECHTRHLAPLGITSFLAAPVRLRGMVIGMVALEHIGEARRWSPEEQLFAGSIADIVALSMEALDRKERVRAYEKVVRDLQASKGALQEKILDLEKFEEVVIGRELKMMSMEKELEILRAKINGTSRPGQDDVQ
jgi:DNA-binding response OmpR family regulator